MNKGKEGTNAGTPLGKVDAVLDSAGPLSPAPTVVTSLLSALSDPNTDAKVVGEMISFDSVLTAKLLRVCNSAALALRRRVDTTSEAVAQLGFQLTRRVVTVVLMVERLKALPRQNGFDARELWRHSVTAAFAAQVLAEDLGLDTGMLFTAGLMHDIGKQVLSAAFHEKYALLANRPKRRGGPLVEQELAVLGVSHPEAGARLLERWSSPDELTAAICKHHDPMSAGDGQENAACVEVADALAHAFAQGTKAAEVFGPTRPPSMVRLGLAAQDLQRHLERIEQSQRFVEALFGLQG